MSTWAIIAVRGFEHGKSRLAPILSADERAAYARGLFEGVLAAAQQCAAIDRILVATDASELSPSGCLVLADAAHASLAMVVDAALEHVHRHGAQRAVVLMSDRPLITSDDIADLDAFAASRPLVVVPDTSERGTNAIAVALPARYPTCFGNADSFDRHRGLEGCAVYRNSRIARDVDTPDDYRAVSTAL